MNTFKIYYSTNRQRYKKIIWFGWFFSVILKKMQIHKIRISKCTRSPFRLCLFNYFCTEICAFPTITTQFPYKTVLKRFNIVLFHQPFLFKLIFMKITTNICTILDYLNIILKMCWNILNIFFIKSMIFV